MVSYIILYYTILSDFQTTTDDSSLQRSAASVLGGASDVTRPEHHTQLGQLSLLSSREVSSDRSELQLDVRHLSRWRRHLVNAYEV